MGEHPVPRAPKTEQPGRAAKVVSDEPPLTPKQQQAVAHARGRICKQRGCEICAPLRERRRLAKARRKADAQGQAHSRGEPCGRNNCTMPVCVAARHATPTTSSSVVHGVDAPTGDAGTARRRQAERHRAGLPCGFETCAAQVCVDGFAQERARRHRARRPCKSAECANPICVAGRTSA